MQVSEKPKLRNLDLLQSHDGIVPPSAATALGSPRELSYRLYSRNHIHNKGDQESLVLLS